MVKKRIYELVLIFFLGIMPFISIEKFNIAAVIHAQELVEQVSSESAQNLVETGKIYVKDDYIYINEFYEGVHVINNLNPYQPKIASFIKIPGNVDIAIRNNILYADSFTDLVVININNPTDVSEIKRIQYVFPDRPRPSGFIDELEPDMRWSGGGCFPPGTIVLTAQGLLAIEAVKPGMELFSYDLSSREWVLSKVSDQGVYYYQGDMITIQMESQRIEATGNHPFFVLSGNKLASRPLPEEVRKEEQETINSGRWVEARDLKTGDVLKSMYAGDLIIKELSTRKLKSAVYHLIIEGCHNYSVGQSGLLVHNQGQKEKSSAPSTSTGTGGSLARFTIASDYLYILSGSYMQLFDIRNPKNPTFWKEVYIGWDIETIFPYEDKLFIGGQTGMYIYDNNNPAEPVLLSRFSHITSCDPVVVQGNYAYVTLRGGTNCGGREDLLEIIDISDIRNPVLAVAYPMDGPFGLGIDEGVLFICDGEGGLKLFDASNVLNLILITVIDNIYPYDVILNDKRAVVVEKYGLNQYDYQKLKNVELISRIPNVNERGY